VGSLRAALIGPEPVHPYAAPPVQTLAEIKSLLESRGLRPKRSLGQNFLVDHNLIRKLVEASGVKDGDLVLEVGPGTGTMTEELLARGCEVIACELDDGLADLLRERAPSLPGGDRFTLIHRDCLEGKHQLAPEIVAALAGRPFSLVANLPYGAGTPLIMTLLLDHPACPLLAVTIQREVGDRLLAVAGTKDYGPLGIIAQVLAHVERIAKAPPECFWPRPDVTSAMVLMRRRSDPLTRDGAGLSSLLHDLFAQRRKQLGGLMGSAVDWSSVAHAAGCQGITPTQRAEQLTPTQIVALGRALGRIRD
jgi:16S rRNA (adenine1518-N6/adenine1519-N6)-dimethyltransferase